MPKGNSDCVACRIVGGGGVTCMGLYVASYVHSEKRPISRVVLALSASIWYFGVVLDLHQQAATVMSRSVDQLHVYVVEDHQDALRWIYRRIGAKRLPVYGSTLLHLDSHPDLQLPSGGLSAADVVGGDPRALFDRLSIGDWILPAVFAGHLTDIVWLRPPWARQLADDDCVLDCGVGVDAEDDCLKIDCSQSYFISELMYAPAERLTQVRRFRIVVLTLRVDSGISQLTQHLKPFLSDPYILDVDLDFFSTRNPFLTLFSKADMYTTLMKLFSFSVEGPLDEVLTQRAETMSRARELFDHLELHGSLDGMSSLDTAGRSLDGGVVDLVSTIRRCYPSEAIDWSLVYDAACTADQGGLPHHVSSQQDIDTMMQQVSRLLSHLAPPGLVTVARSSLDNYCPPEQVDGVQDQLISALNQLYGTTQVHLEYSIE